MQKKVKGLDDLRGGGGRIMLNRILNKCGVMCSGFIWLWIISGDVFCEKRDETKLINYQTQH
jgi:hypothetical protein